MGSYFLQIYCKFGNFREDFIFAKLRIYAYMRSFVKTKSSGNAKITMSFSDICKSCPSREFLASKIFCFNVIHENEILAKISGFTVSYQSA